MNVDVITLMSKLFIIATLATCILAGCSDTKDTSVGKPLETTILPLAVPAWASPDVKPIVDSLVSRADAYNLAGHGARLSLHDGSAELPSQRAATMAKGVNSALADMNTIFRSPIFDPIGEVWYQVPHNISITNQDGTGVSPYEGPLFTITFFNCGRHEIDFVINREKAVPLVRRYDGLNIEW